MCPCNLIMKIKDYKVGTTFEIGCVKDTSDGGECFCDFGITPMFASVFARRPEDAIKVKGTIIEEDIIVGDIYKKGSSYDDNQTDYFAWVEFEDDGTYNIGLFQPNIKLYFMCFPNGPDVLRFWNFDSMDYHTGKYLHKRGDRRGMTVRLKFEEQNKKI